MLSPRQVLLQYKLGGLDDWEVVAWAWEAPDEPSSVDVALEELRNLDPRFGAVSERVEQLLLLLIPGAPKSLGDQLLLRHRAAELLAQRISPLEFCEYVQELDSKWRDSSFYPEGLGELWDLCDWCEDIRLEDAPDLAAAAARLIRAPNDG